MDTMGAAKYNYGYNPAKAKQLLAQGGLHARQRRDLRQGRAEAVVQRNQYRRLLGLGSPRCRVIQQELKAVGIALTPDNLAQNDFLNRLYSGNFQFAYYAETGGPTPYYELRQWLFSANSAPDRQERLLQLGALQQPGHGQAAQLLRGDHRLGDAAP